jgi:hypothetical protein
VPVPGAYREAQAAARVRLLAVEARSADLILRALRSFAVDLVRGMTGLSASETTASLRVVNRAASRLQAQVALATRQGRDVAFQDILGVWQEASLEVAAARHIPTNLLGGVRNPPLTMLGAYESVGGPTHWRTLVKVDAMDAAAEAGAVVREALVTGMGPDELAKRLRRYVVGSEPFQEAFRDTGVDLRRVPPQYRDAARRMKQNAERIAFSELGNARHEAEVGMFQADPLVGFVRWTLSPNRGTLTRPDECDYLAVTDWYGLGPGVYPVRRVPVKPHPWDRCELLPIERPVAQAQEPKVDTGPNPAMVHGNAAAFRLPRDTDATRARAWAQAQRSVLVGDRVGTGALRQAQQAATLARGAGVRSRPVRSSDDLVAQMQTVAARREDLAAKATARWSDLFNRQSDLLGRRATSLVNGDQAEFARLTHEVTAVDVRIGIQGDRARVLRQGALDAQRRVFYQPEGTRGDPLPIKYPAGARQDAVRKAWDTGFEWLGRSLNPRWRGALEEVAVVRGTARRATYDHRTGARSAVNLSSLSGPGVAVHEVGHAVEANNLAVNRAALAFRDRRAPGETPTRLGRGYRRDEVAVRDRFKDPYSGKVYRNGYRNGTTPTEIISMGLEYLYGNPMQFWRDDPDYFRFIVDLVIEGVGGG